MKGNKGSLEGSKRREINKLRDGWKEVNEVKLGNKGSDRLSKETEKNDVKEIIEEKKEGKTEI